MVNKYLECLSVEGNYSKARIGCLLLGLFSLGVFIWLIVLTVQVGQMDNNGTVGGNGTTIAPPTGQTGTSGTNTGSTTSKPNPPGSVPTQPTEKPATTTETPECKTKPTQAKDNPVPGSVCIFPFQYIEKSHDSCTKAGGDFFWCATTVDNKTTEMVPGKWGQCDDDCVKEVNWIGPTKRVWINAQCPLAGFGGTKNLDQCKKDCIEKTGCTAIVYKKGTNCYLRACTQPVPPPTFKKPGYKGYYLTKDK